MPSGPAGTGQAVAPLTTACPPASSRMRWDSAAAMISPPRGTWAMWATRLPMVPLATKRPACLAGQLGGTLLEGIDGGVIAEDVVADLRLRHGAAHLRSGPGDGVRSEVDVVGHGAEHRRRDSRGVLRRTLLLCLSAGPVV